MDQNGIYKRKEPLSKKASTKFYFKNAMFTTDYANAYYRKAEVSPLGEVKSHVCFNFGLSGCNEMVGLFPPTCTSDFYHKSGRWGSPS
ncbi:hypothetical protein LC612_15925 [Nostoc sp. CHAB 5834]|nr:hypothetical protein [Nostoc sp. CHAB 5834]